MDASDKIVETVSMMHPSVQAIYLYGSFETKYERADSDVDIAVLLPHDEAKAAGSLRFGELQFGLEKLLGRSVDLVNLRLASTVLQKEVAYNGRRIFSGDKYAVDLFEMLVLSYYQKLNEERKELVDEFERTGRVFHR
ncbi:MAG: nucleotidyltransferase domain-containing protein [Planctomycetes bacterium]|nr:nucleotidyltransferase domain-containing protein [Planctomycetota bacterium]